MSDKVETIKAGGDKENNNKWFSYMGVSFRHIPNDNLHYELSYESVRAFNNFYNELQTNQEFKDKVNAETDFFVVEIEMQGLMILLKQNHSLLYAYYKARGSKEKIRQLAKIVNYCDKNAIDYTKFLESSEGIFNDKNFLEWYRKFEQSEPSSVAIKNLYKELDSYIA